MNVVVSDLRQLFQSPDHQSVKAAGGGLSEDEPHPEHEPPTPRRWLGSPGTHTRVHMRNINHLSYVCLMFDVVKHAHAVRPQL